MKGPKSLLDRVLVLACMGIWKGIQGCLGEEQQLSNFPALSRTDERDCLGVELQQFALLISYAKRIGAFSNAFIFQTGQCPRTQGRLHNEQDWFHGNEGW